MKKSIITTDTAPAKPIAPAATKPLVPTYKAWAPYRFNIEDIEPTPKGVELATCDTDLLFQVFAIQNPSRNEACNRYAIDCIRALVPKGCTIVESGGNMIVHKGDPKIVRPYYLAHLDQVHDYVPFMTLDIKQDVLYAYDGNKEQTGTGGDDKCGIYVAIAMLHSLENCSAVFVRDEEVGCLGSKVIPLGWFANAAFVIQCDRNNSSYDVIAKTNGMVCASDEFIEAIFELPQCKLHRSASGSITDIGALAQRKLNISMINLSSGYHEPHSAQEVVSIPQLMLATMIAKNAGIRYGNTKWKHTPVSSNPSYASVSTYKGYSKSEKYEPYYAAKLLEEQEDTRFMWQRREDAERTLAKAGIMDEFSCAEFTLKELEDLITAHNL